MFRLRTYHSVSSRELSYTVSWLNDISQLPEKTTKHRALAGRGLLRSFLEYYNEDHELIKIKALDPAGGLMPDEDLLGEEEVLPFKGRMEENILFKEGDIVNYIDRSANILRLGLVLAVPSTPETVKDFEQNCDDVYLVYYMGQAGQLQHAHPHQLMLLTEETLPGSKEDIKILRDQVNARLSG